MMRPGFLDQLDLEILTVKALTNAWIDPLACCPEGVVGYALPPRSTERAAQNKLFL